MGRAQVTQARAALLRSICGEAISIWAHIRDRDGVSSEDAEAVSIDEFRDREFDRILDIVRASLDTDGVYRIMRGGHNACRMRFSR